MKAKQVKSKMVKIDEDVWCQYHGCTHVRQRNPYDYDEPDCRPSVWRALYWRTRAGDEESR